MFCTGCGKEIKDTAKFCRYCGKAVKQEPIDPDEREGWDGEKDLDEPEDWDEEEDWPEQSGWSGQAPKKRPVRNGRAPKKGRRRLRRVLMPVLILFLAAIAGAGAFFVYKNLKTGVSGKIDSIITEAVEPYLNEDGMFDYDVEQLEKAGKEVYASAKELVENGEIADATYCEEAYSVAFFLNDGTVDVYLPEIAGMYAGAGEDEEFSVMLVNNHINEDTWDDKASVAFYYSNPLDIIIDNFEGASTEEYSKSVTVDSLKTILSSLEDNNMRAIFWRGHGGMYNLPNGEKVFAFVLGEVGDEDDDKYAAERLADENGVSQVVRLYTSEKKKNLHYAVTYRFMEQYLGQNSGGLFFTTSCLAMADGGEMAKVFLEKGFDSYVGSTSNVVIPYGNRLVKEVTQNLCKKDDDGLYMTIGDALQEAADTLSKTDVDVFKELTDLYGQSMGTFVNYQQFDFRLVDNSKIYCTLTSEDGTVDLSQLSVKLVRTDENGTHTASDTRIDGAELVENEGRFLIYDLSTDASCQLDFSYGSTVFKKYSIDKIDPGVKKVVIDLSLEYLDVIVKDQQGQFLTNAIVSVYGKAGDSGVEGLVQTAALTTNESGEQVYRIPVTSGTYYVTATVDGTAVTTDNEVQVNGNTTVTYVQNNLEEQVQLLAEACGNYVGNDPFTYAMYMNGWVTDYDKNGRLELNLSDTEGSGSFTTWRCYEVSETFDGVTEVVWDHDTYMPDNFTDLLPGDEKYDKQQSDPVYYDVSTGNWYYIMYDYLRGGWAQNGITYYTMTKNGNTLELTELGWLRNDNSTDGTTTTTTTTYTVGENTCSTETDFYGAMLAKVVNLQEFSYTVLRFNVLESTDYYTDLWNSASAFFTVS